jgi:hypothetical protein
VRTKEEGVRRRKEEGGRRNAGGRRRNREGGRRKEEGGRRNAGGRRKEEECRRKEEGGTYHARYRCELQPFMVIPNQDPHEPIYPFRNSERLHHRNFFNFFQKFGERLLLPVQEARSFLEDSNSEFYGKLVIGFGFRSFFVGEGRERKACLKRF